MELSPTEAGALGTAIATATGFAVRYWPSMARAIIKQNGNGKNGNGNGYLTKPVHDEICALKLNPMVERLNKIEIHEESSTRRLDAMQEQISQGFVSVLTAIRKQGG